MDAISKFALTSEQEAIREAAVECSESLMITAYAGCGKTSTLEIIASAVSVERALAAAFNVKIKKELERRFPSNFTVLTLNGLGHRAWSNAIGKRLEVDERKLGKLVTEELKLAGGQAAEEDWVSVKDLVVAAMQAGLAPQGAGIPLASGLVADTPDEWIGLAENLFLPREQHERLVALARSVLVKNVQLAYKGVISFDDQIYMSTLFGGIFPRFPLMMVDEAQDLSPLNHLQVKKVVGPDGRLIVVGDPKQAIYAFRGADSSSMDKLRALREQWIDLPLATTFRCPKVVVGRQQAHAPGFVAFETNHEGSFATLPLQRFSEKPEPPEVNWGYKDLEILAEGRACAVLCRNNAPLLSLAFKLLRQGVGVQFLGRDIGKSLLALAKKLAKDESTPVAEFIGSVHAWMDKEITLAEANGKDGLVAGITDRGECLVAVAQAEGISTVGDLKKAMQRLFERESGIVTLSTGHRAKGLEWPLVVHLDPFRIPSRFARNDPKQMGQEMNLKYVIETRAQRVLVEANLEDFA